MPKQVTRQTNRDGEVRYEVLEHLGTIGNYQTGWKKEVNIIEWNGNPSKLDIRDWSPDHQHLSRGVTLHRNEILELLRVLLRNYGQELREIERRERRRESAEPRRIQTGEAVRADEGLENGDKVEGWTEARKEQAEAQECGTETAEASGTENASDFGGAGGPEEQTTWAEGTDPDEIAETVFA